MVVEAGFRLSLLVQGTDQDALRSADELTSTLMLESERLHHGRFTTRQELRHLLRQSPATAW